MNKLEKVQEALEYFSALTMVSKSEREYAKETLAELKEFREEGKSIEERLWQLLDDIDTAGDMFKPEVTEYFKYVVKKSEERHKYLISDGFTLRRRNGN